MYFFGTNRSENKEEVGSGMIAFAVPDVGFVFRSVHRGAALECEYQALLALCRFVEANPGIFKGQKLEVLGDSTAVVYQVSLKDLSVNGVQQLRDQALAFKRKLGFSILWMPRQENRAALEMTSQPTIKNKLELKTDFLETFKPRKNSENRFSF